PGSLGVPARPVARSRASTLRRMCSRRECSARSASWPGDSTAEAAAASTRAPCRSRTPPSCGVALGPRARRPDCGRWARFTRPVLVPELITELSDLDALEPAWDQLAVANRLPLMSPACVRAWWRHLAPATARPQVIVVTDEQQLVGLAPFYIDLARPARRLRLPGIELAGRLAPLAEPGREREVAESAGPVLAGVTPRPELVALEGTPLSSP